MKTAIVIPTRNAATGNNWENVLHSIDMQSVTVDLKWIVDSDSTDQTCAVASGHKWRCIRIRRERFNHGSTRARVVTLLAKKGFDIVVFLSQDVELAAPDTLAALLDFLRDNDVAGCYGRQIGRNEKTVDFQQRQWWYPARSEVRGLTTFSENGLPNVGFFSNAFAAWKIPAVLEYGNFEPVSFGEDTLLANRILKAGGRIGYCAEAVCRHEHASSPGALFRRGFQVGRLHAGHPELAANPFRGGRMRQFRRMIPRSAMIPAAVKTAGYLFGRHLEKVTPVLIFALIWILLLPALLFSELPKRDVASRYAPMAEAFAAGEWEFAFHPRVTPLLPVVAGAIAGAGNCSGYMACKLAAVLLLALGVFPLYAGCRRAYGFQIAAVAALLYAGCSYLLRLGYYGLRETGSVLGMLVLFHAAAMLRDMPGKFRGYLWCGGGMVILLMSRGDVAIFVFPAFLALFLWDCVRNRCPFRSVSAGIFALILLSPLLYYNYRMIGYPVPEVRHAVIFRKLCRKMPQLAFLRNPAPRMALDIEMAGGEPPPAEDGAAQNIAEGMQQ